MTIEPLCTGCEAQGLRPLVVHLADGWAIPVRRREFIMAAPGCRIVIVYQADDCYDVADPLLIADLKFARIGNGPARKRRG